MCARCRPDTIMNNRMGQQSHRSDPRILNRRTLQRDHPYLSRVLRPGMKILDVGCGTGAITAGIAKAVGPDGMALGIDRDDANLALAIQEHSGIKNLRFERADVLALDVENRFDIVTAARTIQWISEPERAIVHMKTAANREGHVVVLDYNLDETYWEPEPPADFQRSIGHSSTGAPRTTGTTGRLRTLPNYFTQQGWLTSRATRVTNSFGAAIPISSTPTHPAFGSTSSKLLVSNWCRPAFSRKACDFTPNRITVAMFSARCTSRDTRC